MRAVRDSVRGLAVAYNAAQFGNQTALVTTDTAGTLGRIRRYPLPTPGTGTAYASDIVHTAHGTWLLLSEFAPNGGYVRPNLLDVDAHGRLLGQRTFSSAACTKLRLYSWQPLAGGGALVVGYGDYGTPGSQVTYTARLDSATALASWAGPTAGNGAQFFPNPATVEAT